MAETQLATTREIAQLLCRDMRTIQRLVHRNVLPQACKADGSPLRNRFDVVPTVQAFIKYLDDQLVAAEGDLKDDALRAERTGLVRAQRERQEMENKVFKGELHRADDVEAIMNDLLTGIKMRMLAIPSRTARLLVGQTAISKVIDILTEQIESALGDCMSYPEERFMERNPEYLRAKGIEAEVLASEPGCNGARE